MIEQTALDFYNQNKDCTWLMDPLPPGSILEQASWILNKSNFGWIELDIKIDTAGWQVEASTINPWLVPHREDNNSGWNSACIHGIDVQYTGAWTNYGYTLEDTVPYHWTTLADNNPLVKRFWKHQFPSVRYRRIRWMELEAESAITPHSDMPGRLPGEENFNALEFGVPINVAVIHPDNCYMVLEGCGTVPFKEGKVFIVNIRKYHSVINFSKTARVHVIGHSYGYGTKLEEFAELVVRSYNKQLTRSANL
jgi:hypothetical protein